MAASSSFRSELLQSVDFVDTSVLWLTEVGKYGRTDGGDGEPRGTDERPQRHHTARVSVLTTAFARWPR